MKRLINYMAIISAFMLLTTIKVDAQHINAGISFGRHGLGGFFLSVGNYFRIPEREIILVRDRRLPDEEVPVVFFIARRAGVPPRAVARLRLQGYSWMDITYRMGLGPEIYFDGRPHQGPPYGRAWGYYRRHRDYRNLSDYEIINIVNSRINSGGYYGRDYDEHEMRKDRRDYPDRDGMNDGRGEQGGSDNYDYHGYDRQKGDNGSYNDNNGTNNDNRNDDYGYGGGQSSR